LANGIGFVIFLGLYFLGYAAEVFHRDPAHFTYVLLAVFASGLYICYRRIGEISDGIHNLGNIIPTTLPDARLKAFKLPILNKIVFVMSEWLALLGLVGNLIGMYVMLKFGDSADSAALSHQILAGLGTAFGSTLVGALAGLWLWVNFHIIETATSLYIEDVKHKAWLLHYNIEDVTNQA
jgi:hypothetical protein